MAARQPAADHYDLSRCCWAVSRKVPGDGVLAPYRRLIGCYKVVGVDAHSGEHFTLAAKARHFSDGKAGLLQTALNNPGSAEGGGRGTGTA